MCSGAEGDGLLEISDWTVYCSTMGSRGVLWFYRNGTDGVIPTGTGGQLVSVLFFATFSDSLTVE